MYITCIVCFGLDDADNDMDHMYADSGVIFVQNLREMALVTEELLADTKKLSTLSMRSKSFIEKKVCWY